MPVDLDLLLFINGSGRPSFDGMVALLSHRYTWAILGLILFATIVIRRGRGLKTFLLVGLAVGITDAVTFRLLKPAFARLRPCYSYSEYVRLVVESCGGNFGFPSNHAANAMAAAIVVFVLVGKRVGTVAMLVAITIGFTRVYLGVHFPGDIVAGFLVGGLIGWLTVFIWRYVNPIFEEKRA